LVFEAAYYKTDELTTMVINDGVDAHSFFNNF